MLKKILIGLGVFVVGVIALGIIFASLSGARQRTGSYEFLESFPGPPLLSTPEMTKTPFGEVESVSPERPSRLVIKTGTIYMVVEDIASVAKNIIQYTEGKGGWVVSSSITEREKVPTGSITVRVPAEIFDEAMAYFKSLAEKVSYEGTQGRDVTEEYIDLQSRLRNLEATETQLLKIMERSGTIPDVLAVQKELNTVRNQIEQAKGRIQYLERSVEMATISVDLSLSEELLPIPPAEKWRPKYVIRRAWRSLLGSLRSISYFLIWIGVYAVIWIPLVVIIWQVRKFWKKRKEIKKA